MSILLKVIKAVLPHISFGISKSIRLPVGRYTWRKRINLSPEKLLPKKGK